MSERLRLLIVGGYGVFGGRIVELLEHEPRLELIVAGRSRAKAEACVAARGRTPAMLRALAFDRDVDLAAQIAAIKPSLVADASGPFQAYGGARYRLVEACIAARTPYLDLADGAGFVEGIAAFDAAAKAAQVAVLSGVSSFPVLTAAVARHLARDMQSVDEIVGGIALSPFALVGLNVIRAIASYSGKRVALRREGRDATGHALIESRRETVAPPGRLPLGNTLFSLVEVPDLAALPKLWPDVRTVWIGAGPRPQILHRALRGFAWLVRLRLLPGLGFMARSMHWAMNRLRWGEHRGGMFVRVRGRDAAGASVERAWHLLAEGDDGPLIPSMAVAVQVLRRLDGKAPEPGARAAVRELELADYDALFTGRAIVTGTREEPPGARLYRRVLDAALDELPETVRAMHEGEGGTATGRATVERGRSPLARLAAWMVGFPPASADVEVSVRFDLEGGEEVWTRHFGTRAFSSRQFEGRGRSARLLCERFGVMTYAMALVVADGQMNLVLRRWSLLGVPMPMWLGPRATAYEREEDGRFRFFVEIAHPLTGLIVRYRGWLEQR